MRRAIAAVAALATCALIGVPLAGAAGSPTAVTGNSAAGHQSGDEQGKHAVTYAVIGDTPYGQPQFENFPNDVAEINADPRPFHWTKDPHTIIAAVRRGHSGQHRPGGSGSISCR